MQIAQASQIPNAQIGAIAFQGAQARTGNRTLDADDFMKLLATQLSAQDPLNPVKDTEFVAQMASFTSLEQMRGLASSFDNYASEQGFAGAANYLGRPVTVAAGELGSITGTVSAIVLQDGEPAVVINGVTFPTKSITSVGATPATTQP